MAKAGFRVLDSDIHIIEPPDLWDRYIDAPFKHQAPRGFADWVLDLRIEIDGRLMPGGITYTGTVRGQSAPRDREGAARRDGRGRHRRRGRLPDARTLRPGRRRDGAEARRRHRPRLQQ